MKKYCNNMSLRAFFAKQSPAYHEQIASTEKHRLAMTWTGFYQKEERHARWENSS
jgi:hypothetical protein